MAKLYFKYGAMGCGKTMQLIQTAFNYEERGQTVCVAKPATDTKHGDKLFTRIGLERPTDFTFTHDDNLFQIIQQKYSHVSCVLIDEAQFLTRAQVDELMRIVVELNIPVMCYGLRLNFRQDDSSFDGATRLLQVAQTLDEIKTICECGRKATANARFLNGQIVVDGPDILIDDPSIKIEYRALCQHCLRKYLQQAQAPAAPSAKGPAASSARASAASSAKASAKASSAQAPK